MKLSFSTYGWENVTWAEFVSAAKDLEFQGIEIDDANGALFKKGAAFFGAAGSATARDTYYQKLSIPCLGYCGDLADKSAESTNLAGIKDAIEKAYILKIPYVSVHAENYADYDGAKETVINCLKEAVAEAEDAGITILVETNGLFSETARLRDLLETFACDNLAAMWDMYSPYYDHREAPENTITNLGAYVKHVQIRDFTDDGAFCLVGEGILPIDELMTALRSVNYDGFVSLKWSPAYLPELDAMDIIFAHFESHMQKYGDTSKAKSALYYNTAGDGRYVWKKDILIEATFSQVLDRMVEEFPDQYAFKYTTLDYTRTYSQFRDDVDTFARSLIAMGVRPGSHVAVWATNVPQWYIAFWAAAKIGAVLVTVNTAYKIHEAEYLFKQSDTHTLVMIEGYRDSNYKEIMKELCPELSTTTPGKPLHCKRLPFLRNIITVGFNMPGCLNWDEAIALADRVPVEEVYRYAANVDVHDVCNMQYTSGTTGFPKGVMLTHHNVVNNGKCIGDRMELSTADRMMIQVPMFHCFGMVLAMTACMTHGATILPLPYYSPKSSLACINQERITAFHGVPTMFIGMFNHEDYRKTDFSYMRTGIMAGAGCPPDLMRRAADPNEMNMRGIVSVYGQTESSPGSTMSTWTDPLDLRCNTVGYAFPNIECKVIDPETGEEVPDGVNGEFCSRGYNTMKGYYKMPKATRETVDKDGWLHSGDLACKDPDGTFRITGRLKDMIIRGGENIYPKEIEEFIYTHPAVQDVQVIGVPDKRYGEEAMACIILKEGQTVTEPEMRQFITASLARHKVPRYIDFVDEFPMNAAGKILKYKMREEAVIKLGLQNEVTKK